ncbi:hypothetical protein ACRAWF_23330 [Streptomyces sp. L7]
MNRKDVAELAGSVGVGAWTAFGVLSTGRDRGARAFRCSRTRTCCRGPSPTAPTWRWRWHAV